ncbi:MAG: type II secretion system protein [Gammaproteobacteria bacterium]|nr:type II secretion system protein [Gammaproteobacteria bacterium]
MTRITHPASPRPSGFTLVEMVFTLVISGIMLALAAVFITRPIEGYQDLTRRALLVNNAESALRQMAREMRNALPKSVRINTVSGFALEMLPVIDGAMYRDTTGGGINNDNTGAAQALSFGAAGDDQFDIHRLFQHIVPLPPLGTSSATHRMVINNRGTTGNSAYEPAGGAAPTTGVITPLTNFVINYSTTATGTDVAAPIPGSVGATHISFRNSVGTAVFHRFSTSAAGASPNQRLYVIETPVTYLCVPNSTTPSLGTLTRYANYPIQSAQPTTAATLDALPGVIKAPVSAQVSACTINSDFNSVRRYGLVTLDLTLSDTTGGTVRLLHQVLVENSR